MKERERERERERKGSGIFLKPDGSINDDFKSKNLNSKLLKRERVREV
jgi:hypothetical protein